MSEIRIFELLDNLSAGGSARARLLRWTGRLYAANAFMTVIVHDFVGERGTTGDRGYCYLSEDSHRWEVLGTLADRGTNTEHQQGSEKKDERKGRKGDHRHPLLPALGEGSHDDWPSSAIM